MHATHLGLVLIVYVGSVDDCCNFARGYVHVPNGLRGHDGEQSCPSSLGVRQCPIVPLITAITRLPQQTCASCFLSPALSWACSPADRLHPFGLTVPPWSISQSPARCAWGWHRVGMWVGDDPESEDEKAGITHVCVPTYLLCHRGRVNPGLRNEPASHGHPQALRACKQRQRCISMMDRHSYDCKLPGARRPRSRKHDLRSL